jgi:hypothetical protein
MVEMTSRPGQLSCLKYTNRQVASSPPATPFMYRYAWSPNHPHRSNAPAPYDEYTLASRTATYGKLRYFPA